MISLQYSDSAFLGQELVGQVYYRDESLRFYPFPTVNANKQVTAFSSSQQDTDQYGMKLTLNSKPMDGWQNHGGWMLIMSALPPTRCSSTAQASASGGLNNKKIYTTGRYPSYDITNRRPSCNQAMTSIISLPSTVAYAISTLKTRLMISSATRSNGRLPPGRLHPPTPFGGSVDYDNFLFNAGLLMHITERQQAWLNFSRGRGAAGPG